MLKSRLLCSIEPQGKQRLKKLEAKLHERSKNLANVVFSHAVFWVNQSQIVSFLIEKQFFLGGDSVESNGQPPNTLKLVYKKYFLNSFMCTHRVKWPLLRVARLEPKIIFRKFLEFQILLLT